MGVLNRYKLATTSSRRNSLRVFFKTLLEYDMWTPVVFAIVLCMTFVLALTWTLQRRLNGHSPALAMSGLGMFVDMGEEVLMHKQLVNWVTMLTFALIIQMFKYVQVCEWHVDSTAANPPWTQPLRIRPSSSHSLIAECRRVPQVLCGTAEDHRVRPVRRLSRSAPSRC